MFILTRTVLLTTLPATPDVQVPRNPVHERTKVVLKAETLEEAKDKFSYILEKLLRRESLDVQVQYDGSAVVQVSSQTELRTHLYVFVQISEAA